MSRPSQRDPFFVSLETLIASSTLLGHELENRRPIRDDQDLELAHRLAEHSAEPLADDHQRRLFACAPLDVLVQEKNGEKEFHIIELNGTGIGGVTNMPGMVVSPVLDSLAEMASRADDPEGLFLLGISGKESPDKPRVNRLMHEKLLFAEALREGLRQRHGWAAVTTMPLVAQRGARALQKGHPVVVMGYMKDLLSGLAVDGRGLLSLAGRHVAGILNDRFCLNVLDHFGHRVDLRHLVPINACFLPGADKAVAYELLNAYLESHPSTCFPPGVLFKVAHNRDVLVRTVVQWLRRGHRVVIKPHATGVGHGIEFFLDPHAGISHIISKIDGSIRLTSDYYGVTGGAFPYTVCEFVETCSIRRSDHPLCRHKYELRVVVYRNGNRLQAFPSIVKVASRPFNADAPERLSLINNVTAATETPGRSGVDFVLPLSNRRTLELIGLEIEALEALCRATTRYVRYLLDRLQAEPARFGLEAGSPD